MDRVTAKRRSDDYSLSDTPLEQAFEEGLITSIQRDLSALVEVLGQLGELYGGTVSGSNVRTAVARAKRAKALADLLSNARPYSGSSD